MRIGRSQAFVAWLIAAGGAHVVLPVILARKGPRWGWLEGRPGRANRIGAIVVGAGGAALLWTYLSHLDTAPATGVKMSLVPEYLVAAGPYRFSRNPMYVAELLMWCGFGVLYGSPIVLAGSGVLAGGMNHAVAREEKTLLAQFGDSYRDYTDRVPRWL